MGVLLGGEGLHVQHLKQGSYDVFSTPSPPGEGIPLNALMGMCHPMG